MYSDTIKVSDIINSNSILIIYINKVVVE